MATFTGLNLTTTAPRFTVKASETPKAVPVFNKLNNPWRSTNRFSQMRPLRAAPDKISDKVQESIKNAEQACSDDPVSGECAAAWDEVEELSAAASHARDRKKNSDPLESFCQDNPETDECRTYDN